jgi:hypothetical protein
LGLRKSNCLAGAPDNPMDTDPFTCTLSTSPVPSRDSRYWRGISVRCSRTRVSAGSVRVASVTVPWRSPSEATERRMAEPISSDAEVVRGSRVRVYGRWISRSPDTPNAERLIPSVSTCCVGKTKLTSDTVRSSSISVVETRAKSKMLTIRRVLPRTVATGHLFRDGSDWAALQISTSRARRCSASTCSVATCPPAWIVSLPTACARQRKRSRS